ncbi:MAG: RNA polymerase sigma factor (sigma-70 family) [Bacteroidia bacterium]|jgi:RNA polymerase sigma factor (sigma-70 family)
MEILIQKCLEKDRVAQAELYKKYHGKLLSLCLRYFQNRDDALDVLNHGFLKVFHNLSSYDKTYDFGGWIYRIVQYTAIDHVRKHLRKERQIPTRELDTDIGLDAAIVEKLYAEDLLNLIHKLPLTSKVVFNLFAIEGFSHKDISKELNMSVGTSKWHVNNARTMLKKWILSYE